MNPGVRSSLFFILLTGILNAQNGFISLPSLPGISKSEVFVLSGAKTSYCFMPDRYLIYEGAEVKEEVGLQHPAQRVSPKGILPYQHYLNVYLPAFPGGLTDLPVYRGLVYESLIGDLSLLFFYDRGILHHGFYTDLELNQKLFEISSSAPTTFSTYLGGQNPDEGMGIDHDAAGNIIITGYTQSLNFPVTQPALQDTSRGLYDGFISKFDPSGNLIWSTYYGSSADDFLNKLVCGPDNSIYVVGHTPGTDLPLSSNPFQATNAGSYDAFVIKLNASGQRVWATYFGGPGGDLGLDITIDNQQNIFFGGSTSGLSLPTTAGCFQNSNNGPLDAWLAKFSSGGSRIWCTFFGGSASEDLHAVTTDNQGNAIMVGGTYSQDLPVSNGCFQNVNLGVADVFVVKFNSLGQRIFANYIGGNAAEDAYGIKTDDFNNIIISGYTSSLDFPVTANCFQSNLASGTDLFVLKLSPTGGMGWATYFGGNGNEFLYGMDTKGDRKYILAASTTSTNLPVIGPAPFSSPQGNTDIFFVKFNDFGFPAFSSYYGGSNADEPRGISVDTASGYFCITGFTYSNNFPVSSNPYQATPAGSGDAILFCLDGSPDLTTNTTAYPQPQVRIFPNPLWGTVLNFELPAGEMLRQISIRDISGQLLFQEVPEISKNNSGSIIIPALKNGSYLIEFQIGDVSHFEKLIIVR
jgi:hypothetical protein